MSNTVKHRLILDIDTFGQVIIWTPAGPVSCMSTFQAAQILFACAKMQETIWPVKQQEIPRVYKSETYDEFLFRGGETKIINPRKEKTTKREMETLTLSDLGL